MIVNNEPNKLNDVNQEGEEYNYYYKYLKYKQKYLEILKMQIGGDTTNNLSNNNLIIHISGPSGAGKTTLGSKLSKRFGTKILVKDIDDLRAEFQNANYGKDYDWKIFDAEKYQKYIDVFINKYKKPIVFVGLNNMPWWHKNLYYNMHAQHNYYIDIDDMIVVKQKCLRSLTNLSQDEYAMDDLVNNNKKFVKLTKKSIDINCGTKNTLKDNNKWKKDYKKQGYIFMSREEIYNETSKIIQKYLK